MAFKTRLLATAAIPFMAIAGYSLPLQAAMIKPAAEIQAQTPIVTVQSEEELVPRKRRNREAQEDGEQQADPGAAEAVQEEPVRKNRKQRQQAEEQQMQSEDNAQAEEPVRKNRKQRQQQAEEQQQVDEVQPSDNAQAEEEPVRKNRKQRQQAQDAEQSNEAVSDEDIVNQGKRKKRQQQAEEQQSEEVQPSDNAQAEEEPVRKNRKQRQQAQDADQSNEAVSDEDIVNQSKRKKRQQAEEQQTDEVQPSDNAETEEPVRKKRKDRQQAEDGQQADDGNQEAQSPDTVTDEDIVNMSKDRKKKRDRTQAETPEAIEKREEIAKDPSKTTDTVVLPVENGAAVLDSDKDADNSGANRERRKRQREEVQEVRVPKSDKDAQKIDVDIKIRPVVEIKGDRIDDFRGYRRPEGRVIGKGDDIRVVFDLDGRVVIRSDDRDRLGRNGDIRYERLRDDRIKEIVVRPNGDRIVTIRNRWGEIIRRSRIDNRDVEIVIFYSPELERGRRDRLYLRDAGDELPPMRLGIPVEDYIIDVSSDPDRDYEEFLSEPPVEQVERVYSVDEVKYSARLRDKVRRIDLDTITFDTGSAEISRDQASSLRKVAEAIGEILDRNPGETFLIEGHTDAVGSDESNLVLSDERAESIASVLTELFEIPAENLVTQGYGERYLKIDTDEDERENRRVTIRRITPLVKPAEVSEN